MRHKHVYTQSSLTLHTKHAFYHLWLQWPLWHTPGAELAVHERKGFLGAQKKPLNINALHIGMKWSFQKAKIRGLCRVKCWVGDCTTTCVRESRLQDARPCLWLVDLGLSLAWPHSVFLELDCSLSQKIPFLKKGLKPASHWSLCQTCFFVSRWCGTPATMFNKPREWASHCIQEALGCNQTRGNKTHKEPDFQIGDQVLASTINFNNLEGKRKLQDYFVGPIIFTNLHGKNAVEVILTSLRENTLIVQSCS